VNGLLDRGFESVKAHLRGLQTRVPVAVVRVSKHFAR